MEPKNRDVTMKGVNVNKKLRSFLRMMGEPFYQVTWNKTVSTAAAFIQIRNNVVWL